MIICIHSARWDIRYIITKLFFNALNLTRMVGAGKFITKKKIAEFREFKLTFKEILKMWPFYLVILY